MVVMWKAIPKSSCFLHLLLALSADRLLLRAFTRQIDLEQLVLHPDAEMLETCT